MKVGDITSGIVSASATIIALVALGTGLYQAKLSRDQAKAAVWPYLIQGNSGNGGYARIVQNVGIGPAIIGAFEVRVDTHVVRSWQEAIDSMHAVVSGRGSKSTTFRPGIVIPAGATIDLFMLPDSNDVRAIRARISHLDTRICYCSFYHDCWVIHSGDDTPRQVKACVDDPETRFRK